jgi:hypothetical protein
VSVLFEALTESQPLFFKKMRKLLTFGKNWLTLSSFFLEESGLYSDRPLFDTSVYIFFGHAYIH